MNAEMNKEIENLIKARNQWKSDIEMYKAFLKSEAQTFEGKYGAQEYISMAKNRLNDINKKLEKINDRS